MMVGKTTITVRRETRDVLQRLKYRWRLSSMDEVIWKLLGVERYD